MGERVRVLRHDGRLVAVKEAGPDGGHALEAEAEVLLRVQGPGVVELIGLRGGGAPALLTAWVGPRSLAEVGTPVPPGQAAALCLAVAATLGRLHRAGIVHGAVEPAHVLLDAHGRPVLCGFGSAGPIGAPVRRPATDRSTPGGTNDEAPPALRPADDVAGTGALLAHLLGDGPTSGLGRTARRQAGEWRALTAAATHACLEDPRARPSLAAFTHAIRRAAPDARLPRTPGRDDGHDVTETTRDRDQPARPLPPRPSAPVSPPRPSARRSRRRLAALPAVVGLLAVGATSYFGLSAWWSPSPGAASASAPRGGTTTPTSSAPAASTPPPTTGSPPTTAAGEPVVIEHAGRAYAVGTGGDVVLVGPWRCDGGMLAAVLRPVDGSVHLFDSWAAPDGELGARRVAVVPGATRLDEAADGPGCAALVVGDDTAVLATLSAEDLR